MRLPNFKCCKVDAGTLLPAGTARVTHLAPPVERLEDIPSKTGDMMVAEIPCRKVLDDKEKKKRKAKEKITTQALAAPPNSEHVSSPTPLNQAKPLEALANEEHVSLPLSVGRMDTLRDQTDEHVDALISWKSLLLKILCRMRKPVSSSVFFAFIFLSPVIVPDGALTREKGLQDRLEKLEEEKKEADQLNSTQADRIKQLEEALKQSEADAHQLRVEKERYAVEAGRGKMVRQRIINQYLPTFVHQLHQSAEYKRSLGEVFSLAVGKGFMDGISIGREDADIQAILKATPNVDPASSDTFMDAYEKLFDWRYPYVDKVARMYLLDPSGLQNIMSDETGPTPDGGPRDTPTASYA
ncbi:hypothetical protein Tco_1009405 [Tanacetum coccineum]